MAAEQLDMFPEERAAATGAAGDALGAGAAVGAAAAAQDEVASQGTARSSVTPVCVKGCEKIVCRVCNAKAMDSGPSAKLDPDGKYCGYWPWATHMSIKEDGKTTCRTPTGRICAICRNVFNMSGLDAKHETIQKFAKTFTAGAEGAKAHADFLKHQKMYLDSVLGRGAGSSSSDMQAVRAGGKIAKAIRNTSLATEKSRGERVEAPQRDFVEKDHWDQALDGVYDAPKETEEAIMGQKRKGCWVHRGRKGVWSSRAFDEQRLVASTEEGDNKGPFGDERVGNLTQALHDGLDAREADRDEKTTQAPKSAAEMSATDLLALTSGSNNLALEDGDKDKESLPEEETDDSGSDSEDEDDGGAQTKAHLQSFFAGSSTQAQPKRKPATATAEARLAKTSRGSGSKAPKSAAPSASSAPSAGRETGSDAVEVASGQVQGEALKLDGRHARFIDNVNAQVAKLRPSFEGLKTVELHRPGFDTTAEQKGRMKEKVRAASSLKTTLSGVLKNRWQHTRCRCRGPSP